MVRTWQHGITQDKRKRTDRSRNSEAGRKRKHRPAPSLEESFAQRFSPPRRLSRKTSLVTDWQSPSVPRSICVPWEVFREEVEEQLDEALNRREEVRAHNLQRQLNLLQGRGAKAVFLGLSPQDQLACMEESIKELAAYVSWRRAARRQTPDEPAAAFEAAWEELGANLKYNWIPRDPCSVLLADGQFFPLLVEAFFLMDQAAPNEEVVVKSELAGLTKEVVTSELSALASNAATNASDIMMKSELPGPTEKVMVKSGLTGHIEKVVVKAELPALADEAVTNVADSSLVVAWQSAAPTKPQAPRRSRRSHS